MTVTINFAPQTEAWINREAQQRGLQPVDLIRRMIEEQVAVSPKTPKYKTPQEHIAAMDAIAAKNAGLPILPDSAFDRESIYEDEL